MQRFRNHIPCCFILLILVDMTARALACSSLEPVLNLSARLPFSSSQFLRSPARFLASNISISARVSSPVSRVSRTSRRVVGVHGRFPQLQIAGSSHQTQKRVTLTLPSSSRRYGRENPAFSASSRA